MCIIVLVLHDYVHSYDGFTRLCAFMCRCMTMCIIVLVLDDYVYNCVGFGRLCV